VRVNLSQEIRKHARSSIEYQARQDYQSNTQSDNSSDSHRMDHSNNAGSAPLEVNDNTVQSSNTNFYSNR